MDIEEIARVAHEANRGYCKALGDNTQPAWEQAESWQRESAIVGVRMHIENPHAGPGAVHAAWMDWKLENGWQYGPVKDPQNKTHPCLVPFSALPREQQAKDYIFEAVVRALSASSRMTDNERKDSERSAFPNTGTSDMDGYVYAPASSGMTLREYYAGQALMGLLAGGPHDCPRDVLISEAIQQADALIAALGECHD